MPATQCLCQDYIIRNVIGNANNRRASVSLEMFDYFKPQASLFEKTNDIHHISSGIKGLSREVSAVSYAIVTTNAEESAEPEVADRVTVNAKGRIICNVNQECLFRKNS